MSASFTISPSGSQTQQDFGGGPEEQEDGIRFQVRHILETEGIFESPIDINLTYAIPVEASPLEWVNYDVPPKKMKITNSGHTVILSAKWNQERPYIIGGPLIGKYVFSQIHFHWGANNMEGSEHTIDGGYCSGEMHVVLFKSGYLTQESALKEKDGVIVLVYLIKIQDFDNPGFQIIVDALEDVQKAHTSIKLRPVELGFILREFNSDYFFYWGTVSTVSCVHYIMWFVTRVPVGISSDQIDALRCLLDGEDQPLRRNFRQLQLKQNRTLLHVSPSSSKYSTLLPIPKDVYRSNDDVQQIYRVEILCNNYILFSKVTCESKYKRNYRLKRRKTSSVSEIIAILKNYNNA